MAGLNAGKVKQAGGNGKKFAPQDEIEVGNYPSRLAQIIDLGRHYRDKWVDGQGYVADTDRPPVGYITLTYELCTEFMKDEQGNDIEDKPRWLSESIPLLPLDSELATSTKRYLAFDRPKKYGGDWTELLGHPCTLTVAHTKKGRAKVGSVTPPMKGLQVPEPKNVPKFFDTTAPDVEIFSSLPQWIQDKIKSNLDYEGSELQAALEGKPKAAAPVKEAAKKPVEPEVVEQEDDEDEPW